MDIADWRKKIDDIDRKLVNLINERAAAAREIGRLKSKAAMPIYEPDREREVFANVREWNPGPLTDRELLRVYERITDVMRQLQGQDVAAAVTRSGESFGETELDTDVND